MATMSMPVPEYKAALKHLGLSQARMARIFGLSEKTAGRWAKGKYPIDPAVAYLLRLMLRYRVSADMLPEEFGD